MPTGIMKVPDELRDYYTDIIAHCYEPDGFRIAAGTSEGKVVTIIRNAETDDAYMELESHLPQNKAVLCLHWGRAGVFVGSKSLLYLYKTDYTTENEEDMSIPVKFDWTYDSHDVCTVENGLEKVFVACDDCRVRSVDVETQKVITEFKDAGSIVEAVNSSEEFVASGGQNGKVHVYEAQSRTNKPVFSFNLEGNRTIGAISVSNNSTWLAAGAFGGPTIFSLKAGVQLTQICVDTPKKIYTAYFDCNNAIIWGGGGGFVYKSEDFSKINQKMQTSYGRGKVSHIYSITGSLHKRLSVAGSTNGILVSDNGVFWNSMVYI